MEALVHWFSQNLSQYISPEGAVFIISMIPLLELRGGLLAASLLKISAAKAIPLCIVGNIIPIPTINTAYFSYLVSKTSVLGMMNRFSGGAFQNMTLCALGISIYISASIVIQMLTVVFRKLEELERNGAYGKKQLERITVSFSIFLSVVGAFSFGIMLRANGILKDQKWTTYLITVGCLCFGSLLLILLGKVIDKKGIGNGQYF